MYFGFIRRKRARGLKFIELCFDFELRRDALIVRVSKCLGGLDAQLVDSMEIREIAN